MALMKPIAINQIGGSKGPQSAKIYPRVSSKHCRLIVITKAAEVDADAELEKRLEKLRLAKGATPYGQGSKAGQGKKKANTEVKSNKGKKEYDYTGETVFFEGGPTLGDLALNVALGTTLVWLPLTFASVGRVAFLKYRFTDKRLSVMSTAPWQKAQTDVAYQEVKDVVTVGRAFGLWGDMVVTLRDNSKIEIRSLDKFLELKKYILERRDALAGPAARDILDDDDEDDNTVLKPKGFA